ncbi:sugar-binding protein [Paenibacillus agaridevorans]|uniref:sugar-binding protein n=1 Tax=Paenibacillus agaridevorans TaxID=171404 RepID=UPI001FECED3F|nr:sugar-binding protein [Paenibacillus agaridevorans]
MWKTRSKRWAVQLLILSLIIPFFSVTGYVPKAEAASSGNMLNNDGFELMSGGKPVGWNPSTGQLGTDFNISNQEKHSGTYSIFIDNSAEAAYPNWDYIDYVPVKDTKEYEFSVWIKVSELEITGKPTIDLGFHGGNKEWVGASNKKMEPEEMTGDWQRFVYRFQPVQGTKFVKLYLMIAGGNGKVYFDDASFVEINPDLDPEPQEVTSSNKLNNADFELISDGKPIGWSPSTGQLGTDFNISDQEKHSGTYSIFIDSTTGGYPNWDYMDYLPVKDTKEYEFSVWLKVSDVAMTGKPTIDLGFHGVNDEWVGASNKKMEPEEMTGDWQRFVYRFQPAESAKKVKLYLMIAGGNGKVYFDDASFVEINPDPGPDSEDMTSRNKLDNASFELISRGKPAGWRTSTSQVGTDFGISDQEKHSGTYSIFIDHSTGEGYPNWDYTESIPVSDTERYEFSVWLKVSDLGMTGTPIMDLGFHGQNNEWVGSSNKRMEKEEFTGDWQRFVYRFQPVQGTKSVKLYLMVAGGTGKVYFDDASLVQLNAGPQSSEGTYRIWTAPSTLNLKRDAAPLSSNEVKLEMAGREYQSGQVLLTADGGHVNITEATISDLSSGSSIIPASDVEVLVQHYVKTTVKSNNAYEPGWYPDALIPLESYMQLHGSIYVESGNNQAVWYTVKTEANTPAGLYTGTIYITANGNVEQVPITVRVRDFSLPEENHAQTAFAVWGWMLSYAYTGLVDGSPEYWEIMKNYYEFLLDYHVTPTALPIPTDDYERYAIDAEPYINDPRVSAYNLPYTVGDFESGRAQALVDDLKSKGLFDKAYYYLGAEIDEPSAAMFPKVRLRSQQIAAIDPNLRNIVTTTLHPDLIDDVNTFTPLFRDFESKEYLNRVKEFTDNGGNIWWYGCVVPANPYPTYHLDDDLISARMIPWMQKSYDIEGNLYWGVNIYAKWNGSYYTHRDIWNDPLAFPGANGDGILLYPGEKYGMNSPIATLRLQAIRDGNQDYEYLWLLEDRINQAAERLGVEVSAKDLIQPYYDRLFTNVKSFTKNVDELQQVRSEIADFIEELAKDPQALILMNDVPNEFLKKEVVVYAAKGTEVTIDGMNITGEVILGNSTSDRYSYIMNFSIGMNEVQIKLKQGTNELTVTKGFMIKSRVLEQIMMKKVINNFSDQQAISGITSVYGSTILGITEDHATGDGKAIKVQIPSSIQESYPGIRIPVSAELKDFRWAQTIEFDTYNATNEPRDILIKFFDNNGVASDHLIGTILAGADHVSFAMSELKNDLSNIVSVTLYTKTTSQEAELYFSDLHLLGVDKDAMKKYELPFSQVIPYIDGKLNDPIWNSKTQLSFKSGVTDNDASVSFHYNDEYLFVAAAVKDQQVINSGSANPWDDDSLEIYVDGTGKQGTYDDHTARYVFRVDDPQVYIYRERPKANEKVKYSYAATAEGYNMEIAIPWRSLDINPVEDNIIGITAHVNDKDINNSSLAAAGKLSLTEDISQDAVSSSAWMPKKFVKEKSLYELNAVASSTMNIDGIIDESAWDNNWNIAHMAFGNLLDETSGGRLGLLWSPTHLYAAFDVKDGNIHAPQTRPVWEETSVELFVDSEFIQGVRDSRTHQYTIRVDDPVIYYNGAPSANLTQGIIEQGTRTSDGYQIEMAIPWTTIGITAEEGRKIGVTAHLNLVEPTSAAALSLTDNGMMDGASTVNYVAFELKEQTVDPVDPDKVLVSITTPGAINAVANGTAKTADALGLPKTVVLETTAGGGIAASVAWDVAAANYDPVSKAAQTFTVNGTVILPEGVVNTNHIPLTTSIGVTVDAEVHVDPVDPPYTGGNPDSSSKPSEYVVKPQDIASDQPVIVLQAGQEEAVLPLDILKQLHGKDKSLTIQQGDAQLVLSPEWIKELLQASEAVGAEKLKLELRALVEEHGQSLASVTAQKQYANVTLPGEVWEVLVKWTKGDKEQAAKPFTAPLVLSLPAVKDKLANYHVYRIGTDGELVYLNEELSGDRLTVQLLQGGQFAGLVFVKKFDDLSKVQWALEAIRELAARQIINGMSASTFAPGREITRAEFAALLVRAIGLAEVSGSTFADVKPDAWYAGVVGAAAKAGLINGQGNNRFAPTAAITREEMAVILKRALEWQRKQAIQASEAHSFADDAQISSWAREATKALAELGIMIGRSNNNFVPQAPVNRAEAAQAIYNYLKKQ